MTKKKSLIAKLALALIVLTLISFCFLGNTFARYTSGNNGEATVTVAKWSITDDVKTGTDTVSFGSLSPSKAAYANAVRTHSTAITEVATITNNSVVSALVTVEEDATKFAVAFYADVTPEYTTEITESNYKETVQGVITILLCDQSGNALAANTEVAANGGTLDIYAVVTWTSDDATVTGDAADARDSWIGKYVETVTFGFTYTAVQNSELPA